MTAIDPELGDVALGIVTCMLLAALIMAGVMRLVKWLNPESGSSSPMKRSSD